ncbi:MULTISPECIES: hypothetical protein [unclassified Pseudonocardia]|uniref:hypothetical protein n=1 Tax=unclassified Pseudonocardia TaxID=2619320 RepID=UPI0001FFDF59|nr:hypothetical protein [Pseudonocardia sp. Ae707_Ps1]OLM20961.1 hypothetical protein Ae707Ps1_5220c [Pseudonocardia sp. Ae707_Ps1]
MSEPNPWLGRPRPARPEPVPDPDEIRLVGPRRRTAVARAVNDVVRGVHVRAFDHGWTVSTVSGYITLCHTLAELLDVVAAPEDRVMLRATALAAADRTAGAS